MMQSRRLKNTQPPHTGVRAIKQINVSYSPNKKIWYQQTWHTIEFSNNKRFRHHEPPSSGWPLRSGATFQSYHLADLCQLGDLISRLNFFGSNRSVRAARVLTLHEISMNAKRSAAVSCTRFSPGFSGIFTPLSPPALVKSVESVVVNHVSHAGRAQRAGRISPARSLSGSAVALDCADVWPIRDPFYWPASWRRRATS